MPARTLHLAEAPSAWIDEQVATGSYPDAAAYVAALVERDRVEAEKLTALHAALDEGEASGISDRSVEQIFAEARERHLTKVRAGWAQSATEVGATPLTQDEAAWLGIENDSICRTS